MRSRLQPFYDAKSRVHSKTSHKPPYLRRRQFALDPRFQLLQRELLQVGSGGGRRPHSRNLGAGAAVDGRDLHDITDGDELEIDLLAVLVRHRYASTTT